MNRRRVLALLAVSILSIGMEPLAAPADRAAETERHILELERAFIEHHFENNDNEAAVEVLHRMTRVDPEHPQIYRLAVRLHIPTKAFDAAEQLLVDLDSSGPGLAYGRGYLAQILSTDGAMDLIRQAIEGYGAKHHVVGQAASKLLLGEQLRRQKRYEESAQVFDEAISEFDSAGYRIGVGTAYSYVAALANSERDYDRAIEALTRSVEILESESHPTSLASSWIRFGRTYLSMERRSQAAAAFQKALDIRRELGDERGVFAALDWKGRTYLDQDDPAPVIALWTEAIAIAETLGDPHRIGNIQRRLGLVYLRNDDVDGALRWFDRALRIAQDAEISLEWLVRYHRATALMQVGRYTEAEAELEEVVANGSRRRKVHALAKLTKIHIDAGELTQALFRQEEGLELAGQRYHADRVDALNRLAAIYYLIGDSESARRKMKQALELATKKKLDGSRTQTLTNLGVLALREKRHEAALESLLEAVKLGDTLDHGRRAAMARLNAANALWKLGRIEESKQSLAQALAYFEQHSDSEGQTASLALRGQIEHDEGKFGAAERTFGKSIELGRAHGLSLRTALSIGERGKFFAERGRNREALADFHSSLDILDSLRGGLETGDLRIYFLARRMRIYELAVHQQALLERATPGAPLTFQLAERARARGLLDMLTESQATLQVGIDAQLIARERELVDAIRGELFQLSSANDEQARAAAGEKLQRLEQELQRHKLEIRRSAPRYSELRYNEPSSLEEIRSSVLRDDEILLRYFLGAESALLWIVDRKTSRLVFLDSVEKIEQLAGTFLAGASEAGLALGSNRRADKDAAALAEALQLGGLPANRRLVIVPDGPLHHVPFEAVRVDGGYLVEKHEVVVAPSASTFALMRREKPSIPDAGFLATGDPVAPEGAPAVPPMPHSRAALSRITEHFPENERKLLIRDKSTRDELLAQPLDDYRYLHFATHGYLEPESPRNFRLQMTPTREDGSDGFIYLEDVFGLRLNAELVVLQACSSGKGELLRGEGLVGLTRAFLYAGARALLVAQWDVADRSTAEFMEVFYEELGDAESAAAALRAAKLRFIRSDRPIQRQIYRWAPFVLVGDPPLRKKPANAKARLPAENRREPRPGSESVTGSTPALN